MDRILYLVALTVVRGLQALPLEWVARLGRIGGAMAYVLDARHRRVAMKNLSLCFGREKSREQIRGIARENFRRIGENYCCAIKTAGMSWEALRNRVEFVGNDRLRGGSPGDTPPSVVGAIGHFGNFELYARIGHAIPHMEAGTTYRGLQQPALNRLLQSLREKSGCKYFERRSEMAALKAWMAPEGRILGFLSDQHAGKSGVRAPFFGVDCATTLAPAVFALRYRLPLYVAICYRTGLARWRIEFTREIPRSENGKTRTVESITRDINQLLEEAVRRDPANWFWVHNRWKPDRSLSTKPTAGLEEHQPATRLSS